MNNVPSEISEPERVTELEVAISDGLRRWLPAVDEPALRQATADFIAYVDLALAAYEEVVSDGDRYALFRKLTANPTGGTVNDKARLPLTHSSPVDG